MNNRNWNEWHYLQNQIPIRFVHVLPWLTARRKSQARPQRKRPLSHGASYRYATPCSRCNPISETSFCVTKESSASNSNKRIRQCLHQVTFFRRMLPKESFWRIPDAWNSRNRLFRREFVTSNCRYSSFSWRSPSAVQIAVITCKWPKTFFVYTCTYARQYSSKLYMDRGLTLALHRFSEAKRFATHRCLGINNLETRFWLFGY